jgi:uncharacterized protein (DUF1330 family)
MAYKIKSKKTKKIEGTLISKNADVIKFKTKAEARKFLKQLRRIRTKYSTTTYDRKGKVVYRY